MTQQAENLIDNVELDDYDEESFEATPEDRGDFIPEDNPVESPTAEAPESEEAVEESTPEPDEAQVENAQPEVGESDNEGVEEQPTPEQSQPKDDIRIPKSRLDKEIARRRALEEQLQQMQGSQPANQSEAQPAQDTPDINEVAKSMWDSAIDGDYDKATGTLRNLLEQQANALRQEFSQQVQQAPAQTRVQFEMDNAAREIAETYPEFNPDSDVFDKEITQEAVELRDMYIRQGYEPVTALRKAAKLTAFEYELKGTKAAEPAPVVEAAPQPKKADVAKKIEAANKQPPQMAANGSEAEESLPDISKLTEEEYDALPEATLRKLRGDFS